MPRGHTVHIGWEDLAAALGIKYRGADEFAVSDSAFEQARAFAQEYGEPLTDDQLMEVQSAIEGAILDHWSVRNVMENFQLERVIDRINSWAARGPQSAIYERKMPSGHAVDMDVDAEGVTFRLYEPFKTAYAEAAFCVLGTHDEGRSLSEFTGKSVGAAARWIAECEGAPIRLDLDRWEDRRTKPTYSDLVAIVERTPAAKKRRRARDDRSYADKVAQDYLETTGMWAAPPNEDDLRGFMRARGYREVNPRFVQTVLWKIHRFMGARSAEANPLTFQHDDYTATVEPTGGPNWRVTVTHPRLGRFGPLLIPTRFTPAEAAAQAVSASFGRTGVQ